MTNFNLPIWCPKHVISLSQHTTGLNPNSLNQCVPMESMTSDRKIRNPIQTRCLLLDKIWNKVHHSSSVVDSTITPCGLPLCWNLESGCHLVCVKPEKRGRSNPSLEPPNRPSRVTTLSLTHIELFPTLTLAGKLNGPDAGIAPF
jgi:hypothetical protein